ncbi:hypothetical protein [Streptomyces sp. NPDC058872]|uniref:hypothetical protein n=1 Tax=Streptomyces sp. NPDC058872 TaxID=3346661 RepID=UPI0036BCE2E0
MTSLLARLASRARALLVPTGRHRGRPPRPQPPATPAPPPFRPAPTVRNWYVPLDGAATVLVRPYLGAHERERAVRLRRQVVLLAATYGIDLDDRVIHPLEATT